MYIYLRYCFAVAILAWLAAIGRAEVVYTDSDPSIAVLEEGLVTWFKDVSFKASFQYRTGAADSKANGLAGRFSAVNASARGLFNKDGAKIRVRMQHERGDGNQRSYEEVTDGILRLRRERPQSGERIFINPRQESNVPLEGMSFDSDVHPLALWTRGGNPLRPCVTPDCADGKTLTRSIVNADGGRVDVAILLTSEDTRGEYVVTVRADATPPIAERRVITTTRKDGYFSRGTLEAKDFVSCNGFLVPRIVRLVLEFKDSPQVMVREWRSTDLGNAPPTDDDFVVEVPASVEIIGLREIPPIKDGKRRIDLASYSKADYLPDSADTGVTGAQGWQWRIIIPAVLFVGALIGIVVFLRAKWS